MSDIKLCRIVTGETVVGERVADIIENCLLLQAMPVEGNQMRMSISPYLAPYSKEKANIHINNVMIEQPADPELVSQYQQITSGIITATPGDLNTMKGAMGGPGGPLNLVK